MSILKDKWKVFAVVQLMICLALALVLRLFCHHIQLLDTDLCWLMEATLDEAERAFPVYYSWAYLFGLMFKFGIILVSVLLAIFILVGERLRENLFLSVFSVAFTLVLAEAGLRFIGYSPGQFKYHHWLHPVDSLRTLEGFVNDSNGIMKVDTAAAAELWKRLVEVPKDSLGRDELNRQFFGELIDLFKSHSLDGDNWKDFPNNAVVQNYIERPINQHGFYSIPFDTSLVEGKRILLLGDSFTWGHSAIHKSRSFANQLLERGYTVFNTGISGTDVLQYELVLKNHFSVVRPELVILNFFVGNDVTHFKRKTGIDFPVMFHTTGGSIMALQNGVQFTEADSAFENVMRNMRIPKDAQLSVLRKTVITTYLWEFLVGQRLIDYRFFTGRLFPEKDVTNELLQPIIGFCDSVKVPLLLLVIPELENGELAGAESVDGLFENMSYHQPKVTPDMYVEADGHFNDAGHKFYADYLQNLIDSCFQTSASND